MEQLNEKNVTNYKQDIGDFRDLQKKLIHGEINKVVLFGCGGHARSIVQSLSEMNNDLSILLVDENANANEIILNCKVQNDYNLQESDFYLVAIGDNAKRAKVYKRFRDDGKGQCFSVISTHSVIGLNVSIGSGTFVASNVYVGPEVQIGNNTIINTSSIVEHEVKIGDNTHIAPNVTICGRTTIGNNVFCGAGSIIIDGVTVCDNVIIGAGAVVRKSITEAGVYVGIPAKKLR